MGAEVDVVLTAAVGDWLVMVAEVESRPGRTEGRVTHHHRLLVDGRVCDQRVSRTRRYTHVVVGVDAVHGGWPWACSWHLSEAAAEQARSDRRLHDPQLRFGVMAVVEAA